MEPAPLEFRILGPLEIRAGDHELPCTARKQRLLLGVLLMQANQVVSSERLIEALWGDRPPETARKALQMHVSQLRKLLDADGPGGAGGRLLETRPPGYELRLAPAQLDLQRFEDTVREARAAAAAGRVRQAADAFRHALAMWRGAPLADLGFEDALRGDIARLEELRLSAIEDRVDGDLALGRHTELIGELERLAHEHPLRERFRAQLMLALYRSGRHAEALDVYRNTRRTLVEQLGIEPSRDLKDLERRVLAQDPDLDAPLQAAQETAAARGRAAEGLIGRARELAELLPHIDTALSGAGGSVLIAGEPGIGKSRLAEALAAYADGRGGRVLVGRCWEVGGTPSYWPWTQALRAWLRQVDPEALRSHVTGQGPELLTILPELRTLLPELPALEAGDVEGSRFRLFESLGALLRDAASSQPLAIFLDDLHAADAASLLLLRFVVRQLTDVPLLIVGCYRDTEVGPDLAAALAELAREPFAQRVALTGLDSAATTELLERTLGHAPSGDLAARVQSETQGNPLFAVEIGRLLASEASDQRGPGALPIPAAVKEAIGQRLRRQSVRCRELLTLASVFGREFGLAPLERMSGLEQQELFEALEEAAAARLVGPVPGEGGRLRFSHVLVRDALYDDLPAPRRLRLHRQIGETLEALYAGNPDPYVAELAHHYLQAGSLAFDKAIEYAERAGDLAASQHGYEEAARHHESALRLIEATGAADQRRTCRLLLSLGDELSRAGNGLAAKQALKRAAAIAEQAGWADELAEAVLGYGGRFAWIRAGADERLVDLLERALAAIGEGDGSARARLLARLAAARRDDPRRDRRVALAQEALEMATRIGDPATLAHALEGQWLAVEGPSTAGDGLLVGERLISLGHEIDDRELVFAGHDCRLQAFWKLADRAGVDVELDAMSAAADELRQPAQRWAFEAARTGVALMEGRFERAEDLVSETLAIGRSAQSWNAVVTHRLQLFVLRRAQGRLAELEPTIARSVHEYPALLRFRCALAHLCRELGRERAARAIVDDVATAALGEEYVDAEWLFSMSLLADVGAALGDERAAARLYASLVPYERLYAHAPVEVSFGSMARGLGLLATTLGRFDDAERHFAAAIDIERAMRAWPWLAHAQDGLAAMLLVRGARGDRERARRLAGEAEDAFRAHGMETWRARAAALTGE